MDYVTLIDRVIKQFYAEGNNEAHSWLLQVQASPEAWTFVWDLLDPSKSWEVQFFAATTIHAKISKQWEEVPKDEYPALRERLLNSMKQSNTPKFVLTKLCQALGEFLANYSVTETDDEKDKGIVEELAEMLPYNSPPLLELLLRVLSALPTLFEKKNEARATKLREGLYASWCKTAWLLQQSFAMCNPNSPGSDMGLYLLAVECALSWLKSVQLPLDTTEQIYPHLLVAATHFAPCRDGVDDENMRGWEVVQECLMMIVTHWGLQKRPQTLWEWARNLVTMARQYGGKNFCQILTAFGEAHSRTFLLALAGGGNDDQKRTSESLIELLLECSELEGRYPKDETCSCISFGFWYTLQDDMSTLDKPFDSRALQALKPIYARLAQALLRKSTLPASPSESGDADEQELFRCYRQDAADTLDYCYSVLGHDMLVLLGQRLSQSLNNSEKWTDIESTLHAFKSLAESVETESPYVPALMDLVLSHIPYDLYPGEVLACACSTMGAYAEWIGEHPDPWLERVLRIVTFGLTGGSATAPYASMALKDLARECDSHLAPFAPSILNTIGQTLPNVAPGGGEGLRLMYAAGKLLNILPTIDEQLVHLDATLGFCIIKIRELLEQPLFVSRDAVTNHLKMITTFFSTVEGPIGKVILEGLLPIFNQIVRHPEWSQDNSTLEAMYNCAQRSLPSLHAEEDARPLFPILVTSYKTWPHPAALNLLRQLVLLFGRNQYNTVGSVFAELSSVTLSGIRACRSVRGDLSDWSDLMEAYLGLLAQICMKNTRLLLQVPDQIPEMLECGIACLALPETRTAKAAGYFLTHAIIHRQLLQTFIEPIGPKLATVILQCVGGEVARNNLDPHADLLVAFNAWCPKWGLQMLRAAFDAFDDEQKGGPASTTQSQREAFMKNVVRAQKQKWRMCEVLKEFSLQCRQQTIGL